MRYIDECLNGLSCDAVMFADEVRIGRTIESPSDVQSLQNDIIQLSTCSQGALMSLDNASFIDITPARFHKLYGAFIRPHLQYSF